MLMVPLGHIFLHDALNIGVNGGNDDLTVLCGFCRPFQVGPFRQIAVFPSVGAV